MGRPVLQYCAKKGCDKCNSDLAEEHGQEFSVQVCFFRGLSACEGSQVSSRLLNVFLLPESSQAVSHMGPFTLALFYGLMPQLWACCPEHKEAALQLVLQGMPYRAQSKPED